MLASTATVTRTSACLRCQLRNVLNTLSVHLACHQQINVRLRACLSTRQLGGEPDHVAIRTPRSLRPNDLLPGERIIGKRGRRRRVLSARLSKQSLSQPSNVIILRDVAESLELPWTPAARETHGKDQLSQTSTTAADIQNSITGHEVAPEEAEVNVSISALKPRQTIVTRKEFEELKQSLLKSYTSKQLSSYLARAVQALSSESPIRQSSHGREIRSSEWRPGETPIEERHGCNNQKRGSKPKQQILEQILRLAWHLTVHSESQTIGEVELKLRSWQISLLCDPTYNGRPYYEEIIRPSTFLKACVIQQYRPDRILRITGRQHDAEEIAQQLKLSILSMQRYELDLKQFAFSTSTPLRDEDIRFVSAQTKCVLALGPNQILSIYSGQAANARNAQRMILSLLDFHAPTSFVQSSVALPFSSGIKHEEYRKMTSAVTVLAGSMALHRSHRNLDLVREVRPVPQKCSVNQAPHLQVETEQLERPREAHFQDFKTAEVLARKLDGVPMPTLGTYTNHHWSYWRDEAHLIPWEAEYCMILARGQIEEGNGLELATSRGGSQLIVQHQVPGVETVLSYCVLAQEQQSLDCINKSLQSSFVPDQRMPFFVVSLVAPSLTLSPSALPRVQMDFAFSTPGPESSARGIDLIGIKAILDKQHLNVSSPKQSVDVRFSREVRASANMRVAVEDTDINNFVSLLQRAVQINDGSLDAPAELDLRLPHWMIHGGQQQQQRSDAQEDIRIRYFVDRLEQVQTLDFQPSAKLRNNEEVDAELQSTMSSLPSYTHILYTEADGGTIYGTRTSLRLLMASAPTSARLAGDRRHDDWADKMLNAVCENSRDLEDKPVSVSAKSSPLDTREVLAMKSAEHSQDSSANTSLNFVTAALRVGKLLSRASAGELSPFKRRPD